MPTFVLKKYEPEVEKKNTPETQPDQQPQGEKPEELIEFTANDSISKIVAKALLQAVPNVEIEERVIAEQAEKKKEAQVTAVSSEEINADPVGTMRGIDKSTCVVIIAPNGYHTAQEHWFLETLQNRKVKTFFTVNSFVEHVKSKLG